MAELKYYAKPMDPEFFNYEYYYNDDDAVYDKFWAGGNRYFGNINEDLIKNLFRNLDSCKEDITTTLYYDDNITEEEQIEEIKKSISYYIKKEDSSSLTNKEISRLFKLINETDDLEDYDIACQVLEIIHGEPFVTGQIKGNSQGDWMYYVCPKKLEQEKIDYIEAVLFATGTEFAVTEEKIDDPEKFDDTSLYSYYTCKWNNDDIKQEIADHLGCSKDEVEILEED